MSHCVEIIVFYLENNNWLLHLVIKKDASDDELYNEARLKYEFVQLNNIISIYERIPIENVLMIDYHVKRYMSYYGIENVRGGVYKQTFFDSTLVERLHNEIFFDYQSDLEENNEISLLIRSLRNKSEIELNNLRKEIKYKIGMRNHAELMITNVRYFHHDNIKQTIDRDTCTNIEKIINSIEGATNTIIEVHTPISSTVLKEYEKTIMIFPFIYDNFKKLGQYITYKLNPEIIISSATHMLKPVYSEEEYYTFDAEYIEMALKILNYYKYMTNCIINRCDEFDFDIVHYDKLLTKDEFITIRYLEDYI
jgi:hypothetical protein